MDLGKAFIITIPDGSHEERLLAILKRRKENYPIIARANTVAAWPVEYLVSSLDGDFLHLSSNEAQDAGDLGLRIRLADPGDYKNFFFLHHPKK